MKTALFAILSCLALAGVAAACPASFVTALYNQDGVSTAGALITGDDVTDSMVDKAGDVADGYMRARGLEPNSPSGDIIRPYLGGTAIVEDYWNSSGDPSAAAFDHIDFDDPTDQIVSEALGSHADDPIVGTPATGGHGHMSSVDHFIMHFGDGVGDAESQGEVTDIPPPADKKGG